MSESYPFLVKYIEKALKQSFYKLSGSDKLSILSQSTWKRVCMYIVPEIKTCQNGNFKFDEICRFFILFNEYLLCHMAWVLTQIDFQNSKVIGIYKTDPHQIFMMTESLLKQLFNSGKLQIIHQHGRAHTGWKWVRIFRLGIALR